MDSPETLLQLLWKSRQLAPQLWGADVGFNHAAERVYLEVEEMSSESLAQLSKQLSVFNVKASLVFHHLEKTVFQRVVGEALGLEQGVETVFPHRGKLPANAGTWFAVLSKNAQLTGRGKLLLTVDQD